MDGKEFQRWLGKPRTGGTILKMCRKIEEDLGCDLESDALETIMETIFKKLSGHEQSKEPYYWAACLYLNFRVTRKLSKARFKKLKDLARQADGVCPSGPRSPDCT